MVLLLHRSSLNLTSAGLARMFTTTCVPHRQHPEKSFTTAFVPQNTRYRPFRTVNGPLPTEAKIERMVFSENMSAQFSSVAGVELRVQGGRA